MKTLFTLAFTLAAFPVGAQPLDCTATQQCRGDAVAMCAGSSLDIRIRPAPGKAQLWIDHQGPYRATRSIQGETTVWTLGSFGGGYTLELHPDGQFTYRGNRGKRYSGRCQEVS